MAPPTPLAIATQAVNRLVKEESYYHKEQANQEKRIKKLEEDIENNSPDLDSNAEYILKQEKTALDETKAMFGPLRKRIADAVEKLEEQIAISESDGTGSEEELKKAKEALASGQKLAAEEQEEI
ncbi:78947503-a59f-40e1-9e61-1112fd28ad02 [Thermothielavioides terrestris]|uniref:Tubulin-specific chaperone A n=1 Tax=Thermothielavioides terrestris TaxID=2587410 RepID=A0A3S4CZC9_9PEZI|nr:78947503-a59f-40e1-9e61-1112fd28ad02 [Thermothielavioides terrestris]